MGSKLSRTGHPFVSTRFRRNRRNRALVNRGDALRDDHLLRGPLHLGADFNVGAVIAVTLIDLPRGAQKKARNIIAAPETHAATISSPPSAGRSAGCGSAGLGNGG